VIVRDVSAAFEFEGREEVRDRAFEPKAHLHSGRVSQELTRERNVGIRPSGVALPWRLIAQVVNR
jgi:hypothetical protein